jgi:RHH-type proline utilization regulon transcriptional repressor/proline dehydrogenase/delta 1-pyrroline-5-carboxylate dehydrogenase
LPDVSLPDVSLHRALRAHVRRPEAHCVHELLRQADCAPAVAGAAREQARAWIEALRGQRSRGSGVDALMREFSLSSQEGVALMCLAEALARIPDRATADALIRDKLARADWRAHIGSSRSIFVNAAAWGLMITGKLVATHSEAGLSAAVNRMMARGGEPLVRAGVDIAMRLLGQQFVLGRTIEQALARAREAERRGYRHSYDMLGEAALTEADARAYLHAYAHAIEAIGASVPASGLALHERPGISVKLSALHPRFTSTQPDRLRDELLPRIRGLCIDAQRAGIGLNIDAEESERLEPTLELFCRLAADPALRDWEGLGIVVQAYQRRALALIDCLADAAHRARRRIMVRLVKGAYWDSEIKRAQVEGQQDFPVFTRKCHTDLSYLAGAQRLLAHHERIYPQFATHNALTLACVLQMADAARVSRFELQCLHGMGETLYDMVVGGEASQGAGLACRIYAPVGSHETLLAYLVRRLLENGANSSFVNQVVDDAVPVERLLEDPVDASARSGGAPHPAIALPAQLYAPRWRNSPGIDLHDASALAALEAGLRAAAARTWDAAPILGSEDWDARGAAGLPVTNPARRDQRVGIVHPAGAREIEAALTAAMTAAMAAVSAAEPELGRTAEPTTPQRPGWAQTPRAERAAVLERVADALQERRDDLIWLAVAESGKTLADAAAELREAIDFCRYYAYQARTFLPEHRAPRGIVVAISPWNFPLAIFTGQIAAALAAGNAVIAKPAQQSPLIAALAVRVMHAAGVPRAALQLLPGDGAVGAALVRDARVRAVLFTGSTQVAASIDRALAERGEGGALSISASSPLLVAETGGQNAMIVDSSAQPEQVVQDALVSAFGSAGQRCSALRVLCLQEEIAEPVLTMLCGAAAELRVGDPADAATDLGPVIDEAAHARIAAHLEKMAAARVPLGFRTAPAAGACFLPPAIVRIESVGELSGEVFGPVLHVLRYRREALGELIDALNATGYALTCGIHSRIDETIDFVRARTRAGNVYVNRNMIGAVVGVQPFGGQGLSGTGPKAGGPWTVAHLTVCADRTGAPDADADLEAMDPVRVGGQRAEAPPIELRQLREWLQAAPALSAPTLVDLVGWCERYAAHTPIGCRIELPGPTGETNVLVYRPRGRVLCLGGGAPDAGDDASALLHQLAAVVATANRALWVVAPGRRRLFATLPLTLQETIDWTGDWRAEAFELALLAEPAAAPASTDHGAPGDDVPGEALRRALAHREGARTPLLRPNAGGYALYRMVAEQVVTTNTAAAGGNATLMSLAPA